MRWIPALRRSPDDRSENAKNPKDFAVEAIDTNAPLRQLVNDDKAQAAKARALFKAQRCPARPCLEGVRHSSGGGGEEVAQASLDRKSNRQAFKILT
jgi:hypothetical protein